ncbi:MAG: PINc/VapC family ATPase [Thermoplasmatota archaeon]
MKIVPDTSVIIDGRITSKLAKGELNEPEIIIPEAVISELEAQANKGQEIGLSGLEEIQALKKLHDEGKILLSFKGERPSFEEIKLAPGGEIDYMIRDLAKKEEAILLTSDIVQAEVSKAKGLKVEYLEPIPEEKEKRARIWNYFKEDIMSVHLKENTKPKAKIGIPGNMRIQTIGEDELTQKQMRILAHEIIGNAKRSSDSFIEIDKGGATIVQLEDLRIVIARPPFSDGFEITAAKPVAKVTIDDYRLSKDLKERFAERRRGILVAGSPGAGKSTLAQAVAEYLLKKNFIVKTMEEPRDLQVSDEITQYTSLEGNMTDTADLLLLVRPDYTIYDEIRKTPHFKVFADMRLAGVGMIGVTHANRAIDALQRLIGRVELGMVPQVVDTVVFVEDGDIDKVYETNYTVKVPAGMVEKDLARPVIEVKDFETKRIEFEVYSYGEQIVVMPVDGKKEERAINKMATKEIERKIESYIGGPVDVEILSNRDVRVNVPDNKIPAILGKGGRNISRIEEELGFNIDVQSMSEGGYEGRKKTSVSIYEEEEKMVIDTGYEFTGEMVDVYADDDFLFNVTVGRDGTIKIRKETDAARQLRESIRKGKDIKIV